MDTDRLFGQDWWWALSPSNIRTIRQYLKVHDEEIPKPNVFIRCRSLCRNNNNNNYYYPAERDKTGSERKLCFNKAYFGNVPHGNVCHVLDTDELREFEEACPSQVCLYLCYSIRNNTMNSSSDLFCQVSRLKRFKSFQRSGYSVILIYIYIYIEYFILLIDVRWQLTKTMTSYESVQRFLKKKKFVIQ